MNSLSIDKRSTTGQKRSSGPNTIFQVSTKKRMGVEPTPMPWVKKFSSCKMTLVVNKQNGHKENGYGPYRALIQ